MRHVFPWLFIVPFIVGQIGDPFGDGGGTFDGLLNGIAAWLVAMLQFIWSVLVAVVNFIISVLNFVWTFLTTLFADIQKAFKWIWNSIIKTFLTKLVSGIARAIQWLHDTFKPLVDFLMKIRRWLDHYFNLYVKPILNAIQQLRKFLQIFRFLGFKWAAKLDALLGKIQADILKAYELIRQNLNQVISWVQLIVDPTFLLRRVPLFGSLIRSKEELTNLVLQSQVHPITQDEADKMNRNRTWYMPAAATANQTYYAQGQLPPDIEAARMEFMNVNLNPGDVNAS